MPAAAIPEAEALRRRPRIASTHAYPLRPAWTRRVHAVAADRTPAPTLVLRLAGQAAATNDVLILDGSVGTRSGSPDLVAAALIARRRDPPRLVLTECNWKPGAGPVRLLRRAGIRSIDAAVARYCVYTSLEVEAFPRRWGVSPEKMLFTPFYHHLSDAELAWPPVAGHGIFAGGESLRDYATLTEALHGVDAPVCIASATRRPADLPGHVAMGRLTHPDYIRAMHGAAICVVPIRSGVVRSAGLETFLSAMALGTLVIVSDSPGVRDYIDDGRTGLIVPPGEPGPLRRAIRWALDPANARVVSQISAAGRDVARSRFNPDRYVERLLAAAEAAALQRTG